MHIHNWREHNSQKYCTDSTKFWSTIKIGGGEVCYIRFPCCQGAKMITKHWPQPLSWLHPFFTHHRTEEALIPLYQFSDNISTSFQCSWIAVNKMKKCGAHLKLDTGVVDVGVRGVSHVTISTTISSRYWTSTTVKLDSIREANLVHQIANPQSHMYSELSLTIRIWLCICLCVCVATCVCVCVCGQRPITTCWRHFIQTTQNEKERKHSLTDSISLYIYIYISSTY